MNRLPLRHGVCGGQSHDYSERFGWGLQRTITLAIAMGADPLRLSLHQGWPDSGDPAEDAASPLAWLIARSMTAGCPPGGTEAYRHWSAADRGPISHGPSFDDVPRQPLRIVVRNQ